MKKYMKIAALFTLLFGVYGCNNISSNEKISSSSSLIESSSEVSSFSNSISQVNSSKIENSVNSSSISNSSIIESSSISSSNKEEIDLLANVNFTNWVLWSVDNKMTYSYSNNNKNVTLGILHDDSTVENWSFQAKYESNLYLEEGVKYNASITINSSINRKVQLIVQTTSYSYMLSSEVVNLNANEDYTYNLSFTCDQTDSYLFGVMLGKVDGSLYRENHEVTLSNASFKYSGIKEEDKEYSDPLDPYAAYPSKVTVNNKELSYSWSDEFNGTSLDESTWTYEYGAHGWGNNEKQYYRKENTSVSDGYLSITAKKEDYNGAKYTSSRIITMNKYETHYGYFEARISLPRGNGIWPAFWMLGANFEEINWPFSGEIDIMEAINSENKTYSTIHYNNGGSSADYSHGSYGNNGHRLDDRREFHTYSLYWDEKVMIFYVDGISTLTVSLTPAYLDCFHKDHFFIFNVAVGGNWPGFNIDDSQFSTSMKVDYLRVYK